MITTESKIVEQVVVVAVGAIGAYFATKMVLEVAPYVVEGYHAMNKWLEPTPEEVAAKLETQIRADKAIVHRKEKQISKAEKQLQQLFSPAAQ